MAAPVAIKLAGAMEIAASATAGGGGGGGGVPKTPTSPTAGGGGPLPSPTGVGMSGGGGGILRSPSPYVNLNVREVFETNGLEQTKEISRKVNLEIEKKKEELRTLVGERYRDLIDAADTIAAMSTSSAAIFEKLGSLRQQMSTLSSLNTALPPKQARLSSDDNSLNKEELEIAFELKLSLEAPRVIQKCLDEMKVISATHISLLFDRSLCQSNRPYKWSFLQSTGKDPAEMKGTLKHLILKCCDEMMEDFGTPPEKLAECVAAKQILSGSSCNDTISELLSKRIEMTKVNLLNPNLPKETFVENIASTLKHIYSIFIDGLYNVAVKDMKRPKVQMSLFGIKYLPKSVDNFNNSNISVDEPPRASEVAQLLLKFFVEPLKLLLSQSFRSGQYLVEQERFEELSKYQKETQDILKDKIEDLMRIVLGTSNSLWAEVFYPVFQQKGEQVGKLKLDRIFKFLEKEAFPKYKKLDEEFNLVEYIWKASSLKNKTSSSASFSSNKDVDLKLKCISPQVADICGEVELRFVEFLKDFKTLGDFSLKKFISFNILEKWTNFLEEAVKDESLFLGRLCSSLQELCPTIFKLMELKDSTELRGKLVSVSEKCWLKWSTSVADKFSSSFRAKMGNLENESVAVFMPVAELFVPEKGEGEDSVAAPTPSVRVPLQINHVLHNGLFVLCNDLARVGPQSIPKRVREELRLDIGTKVISLYKELMEKKESQNQEGQDQGQGQGQSQISPQTALQLIFDVKFCQWFHLQLKEQADPLIKTLQGIIDPFDMDIVGERLKANLKRFLFETHLTIGLLFSEESHSFIAQNFKTKLNMSFPTSNTPLRSPLPLLPV